METFPAVIVSCHIDIDHIFVKEENLAIGSLSVFVAVKKGKFFLDQLQLQHVVTTAFWAMYLYPFLDVLSTSAFNTYCNSCCNCVYTLWTQVDLLVKEKLLCIEKTL